MRLLLMNRLFIWIYPLLTGMILLLGFLNNAWFDIICTAHTVLFWLVQLKLTMLKDAFLVVSKTAISIISLSFSIQYFLHISQTFF